MSTAEIVTIPREDEWSVARIVDQTLKVQECMKAVMKRDEHYGVIPGTNTKPTLLKPGAEKLCLLFRLCPEYETMRAEQSRELVSYTIRCVLTHIPTGNRVASGLGSCNSREKKYLRPADKKCPNCGKETIIKGKEEFGGGWLCWAKKGGCNAKFKDGDATIEQQDTGLADPSDLDNTILKMACKRALVAAVLNGTAASDCFTQDLEDLTEKAAEYQPPRETVSAEYRATVGDGAGPKDGAAPTSTPATASTSTTTANTPTSTTGSRNGRTKGDYKPANEVPPKSPGKLASPQQIAEIDELQPKTWDPQTFAKAVNAYKCVGGKRAETAGELQEHQADNLLKRMRAQASRNAERLASMDAATEAHGIPANMGGREPIDLDNAFKLNFDMLVDEQEWLNDTLGLERREDIPLDMYEEVAQLLFARQNGTLGYEMALAKFRARRA